ncbi:MAG: lysine biosynthesis protein LysX [Crenarchaeota archaeon]|nr:lysine biosynthesis protein LysX [Thermoproteota archaeon]
MSSIAILVTYDLFRLDEKLLVDELKRRSIEFKLINLDSLLFDTESTSFADASSSDIVLMRSVSHTRSEMFSRLFEELGLTVVNSFDTIWIGNNKFLSLVRLARAGVPVPRSILAVNESKALEGFKALSNGSCPVIIKPISGSWGRMVSLVYSDSELSLLVKHRLRMENPYMRMLILQEYVDKPGRDIRVIVVEDRAVAAIYRHAPSSDWRTNTARGGRAEAVKIDKELEEISVRASKAVGAHYAGVDVVESKDGYIVLEVNVVPEFKNVMRVTGINVAGEIIDMLIRLAKR